MAEDMRDRTADALIALIPLYYKNVMRHRHAITGVQIAQIHTLGVLMKYKSMPMSEIGSSLYISRPVHDPARRPYDCRRPGGTPTRSL